jgi:hypothetical protein
MYGDDINLEYADEKKKGLANVELHFFIRGPKTIRPALSGI